MIVQIFKKKDKTECDNYIGISLLCDSEMIFASDLLQRIKVRTEAILSAAQAGERSGRSTIDQLYTLRNIAEKYLAHGTDLYACYIDIKKVFHSVWRERRWKVDGYLTDWFRTLIGVLQGCVLSPNLINVLLEMVMVRACEGVKCL